MITDYHYQHLIRQIHEEGDELETRNYRVKSCFDLDILTIVETPLVTLRKTAWKKALRELEWFISGEAQCPDELLDWWNGQLNPRNNYYCGYSEMLRWFPAKLKPFDQINYILNGLKSNPNSRRLCMTVWHPEKMAHITELNENPKTPTCCHFSFVQYFVRNHCLHAYHYQRSADVLLGLPHNLIQHWALLLYFAHHANLYVGNLRYQLGDAHLYQHPTHVETVRHLLACTTHPELDNSFELVYNPVYEDRSEGMGVPVFRASDFVMTGTIPEPKVLTRPVLL